MCQCGGWGGDSLQSLTWCSAGCSQFPSQPLGAPLLWRSWCSHVTTCWPVRLHRLRRRPRRLPSSSGRRSGRCWPASPQCRSSASTGTLHDTQSHTSKGGVQTTLFRERGLGIVLADSVMLSEQHSSACRFKAVQLSPGSLQYKNSFHRIIICIHVQLVSVSWLYCITTSRALNLDISGISISARYPY